VYNDSNEHLNDRNSKLKKYHQIEILFFFVKDTLRRSGQSAVFNFPAVDDGSIKNLP